MGEARVREKPSTMRQLGYLTFIVIVVAVLYVGGRDTVQREVFAACRDGTINAQRVLDAWRGPGVIASMHPRSDAVTVSVVTALWEKIGRDAQISIGLAAYCTVVGDDGKGFVAIQGSRQEDLGSVVNGNWQRP